jgi:hypothetical protein
MLENVGQSSGTDSLKQNGSPATLQRGMGYQPQRDVYTPQEGRGAKYWENDLLSVAIML